MKLSKVTRWAVQFRGSVREARQALTLPLKFNPV